MSASRRSFEVVKIRREMLSSTMGLGTCLAKIKTHERNTQSVREKPDAIFTKGRRGAGGLVESRKRQAVLG